MEESPSGKRFTFYLKANECLGSTVKPVRFRVSSSNDKHSKEEIVQFVYEQCYNYYNYHGAMAVPAALQYVLKLKRAVRHFKHEN